MKLLYCSQNFWYDTKDSDKDCVEFVYPRWEEIGNAIEDVCIILELL